MHENPVVIVTGASRGLGASVARWLGKVGAGVALMARSTKLLEHVARDVERVGGVPLPLDLDVIDPDACRRVVQKTLETFGRLDALVNNAGVIQPLTPIAQADSEAWHYTLKVNLMGPFYMTRFSIPELRKQKGRIVNVSSGAASTSIESASAYCASKAALNHFTRVLASEESQLTCVAVRPGVVDTDMQTLIRREGSKSMPPEQADYYRSLKTRGQLEPPWVPGRSIAWLALHAPRDFSGDFLDYDDPRISKPSRVVLGEYPG